jgi:cytochrome c oxidase assembly protein subunit 15
LLVVVQLVLGIGSWVVKYGWPGAVSSWDFAAQFTLEAKGYFQALTLTAHVAVGALILATSVLLLAQSTRRYLPIGATHVKGPSAAHQANGPVNASRLSMESTA